MVRFTLRQCTYFRAVAEHGGIAQAARALNISQPSVSQALEKLEDVTGLVLFDRHHARGLTLTLQGRIFLKHVTQLEDQASQVEREAAGLAAETAGEIRLGIFWTLAPFYAPSLIQKFTKKVPGVSILQQEMSLADLAHALRQGTIDLALTYDRGAEPEGLAFTELAVLHPMVVVAEDHPLAGRRSIRLAELAHEPYVMLDAPGSRTYFEGLLAENSIAPPISYVSNSLESVRSAVAAGFGFTLLVMRPPTDTTYDGRRVKTLRIEGKVASLRIVLASREGAHRGLIFRHFTQHSVEFFAGGV
ncbi:LysR family transcriptional regulator [Ensifer sp. YR511]|uniref:LysR family transcriptional regulator n=1 Tax=Ensifer sp. YR511 TaxID=1855294 RepID=UPI000888881C|nr:LysR family transcriptional regulator [Ensifer sp. YR511]SDN70637.1 DNA-binding transcriptional regulator, LysR family [Ensifer sp. YR511]